MEGLHRIYDHDMFNVKADPSPGAVHQFEIPLLPRSGPPWLKVVKETAAFRRKRGAQPGLMPCHKI